MRLISKPRSGEILCWQRQKVKGLEMRGSGSRAMWGSKVNSWSIFSLDLLISASTRARTVPEKRFGRGLKSKEKLYRLRKLRRLVRLRNTSLEGWYYFCSSPTYICPDGLTLQLGLKNSSSCLRSPQSFPAYSTLRR